MHARADVLDDSEDSIDIAKLRPVSKLGEDSYSRLTEAFSLQPPARGHGDGRYNGLLG